MTAYTITCAVIPEREDDGLSAKFLVVAPDDRIIWMATSRPGYSPDLSPEGRKKAVAQAGLTSMAGKLNRQESDKGDILALTDNQIDCRERNMGACNRYPQLIERSAGDHPEGAVETNDEEDVCPGVLECWMLESEVD
ncbi:MAG: hypothetical protein WC828_09845 [Thermoleophilia bacterium]|jgi:hypothetical protein